MIKEKLEEVRDYILFKLDKLEIQISKNLNIMDNQLLSETFSDYDKVIYKELSQEGFMGYLSNFEDYVF